MRGSAKEFRQIERQAGTFAETLTDTLSPSHRCSYRRGIPSPSLPDLIRQPALQQLGVGCRVEPGNDGESATVRGRNDGKATRKNDRSNWRTGGQPRHGGRRPTIHGFAVSSTASRGWRVYTRHDAEGAMRNTKRFVYCCASAKRNDEKQTAHPSMFRPTFHPTA